MSSLPTLVEADRLREDGLIRELAHLERRNLRPIYDDPREGVADATLPEPDLYYWAKVQTGLITDDGDPDYARPVRNVAASVLFATTGTGIESRDLVASKERAAALILLHRAQHRADTPYQRPQERRSYLPEDPERSVRRPYAYRHPGATAAIDDGDDRAAWSPTRRAFDSGLLVRPASRLDPMAGQLARFLGLRTELQRHCLREFFWAGSTYREISASIGSDISGRKNGSAPGNIERALVGLRADLLLAFAGGVDPDDVELVCATCAGRFHSEYLGRRKLTTWDTVKDYPEKLTPAWKLKDPARMPPPEPVTVWEFAEPEPRIYPDPDELKEWERENERTLELKMAWAAAGFVSAPDGEFESLRSHTSTTPGEALEDVDYGYDELPGSIVPTWQPTGEGWRDAFPKRCPDGHEDQPHVGRCEYHRENAVEADYEVEELMLPDDMLPGSTGLHPSNSAIQGVYDGLRRST